VINADGRASVVLSFTNTGANAKGTFLVLDLNNDGFDDDDDCRVRNGVIVQDDDDDDDDDGPLVLGGVNFLEGTGFVRDICGDNIVIGMGLWNVIPQGGTVTVELVFVQRIVITQTIQINVALRTARIRGNIACPPIIVRAQMPRV
jgi:hypothetical protein